jgi:hypothetical protein
VRLDMIDLVVVIIPETVEVCFRHAVILGETDGDWVNPVALVIPLIPRDRVSLRVERKRQEGGLAVATLERSADVCALLLVELVELAVDLTDFNCRVGYLLVSDDGV